MLPNRATNLIVLNPLLPLTGATTSLLATPPPRLNTIHLPPIKRTLLSWLKPEDVSADATGYFLIFGGIEEDAKKAATMRGTSIGRR